MTLEPGLVHGQVLHELQRAELARILSASKSEKGLSLVVEKPLISVLDVLFKFSELESLGVSRIVEWTTDFDFSDKLSEQAIVFCCRSLSKDTLPLMNRVAEFVKKRPAARPQLWFSPFVCKLATNRLTALGVNLGSDLHSIKSVSALQFSALESDTISLQLGEDVFSDYHCRGDPSLLVHVAQAVGRLQSEFGIGVGHDEIAQSERRIRRISAIGTCAKFVADSLVRDAGTHGPESDVLGENNSHEVMTGLSRLGGIDSVAGLLLEGSSKHHRDMNDDSPKAGVEQHTKVTSGDAIDSVIIIDRRTDLFSLLCSQFTYEARIDDEFEINNRRVTFEPSDENQPAQKVTMTLCKATDPLFDEIRDVSVSTIGQLLSKKANFISQCYKEKDSLKSISEVKEFMEKFKQIQTEHASLSNHVSLATTVSELTNDPNHLYLLKIEDQIMSLSKPATKILSKIEALIRRGDVSLPRILRLLCLSCQTYGTKAVTSAGLDKTFKSIVHAHGFSAIKSLHHLEQCGLLKFHNPSETSGVMAELISTGSKWPRIRDEFKLISTEPGEELAEAYSGYVPLSVRLVQLNSVSWKSSADKLNLLRGPALEISQECPIASAGHSNSIIVAVVFVGGVTYGEIAALRRLSALEGGRRRFLIITTGVTSYSRVLSGM
jgi:hypothetical protein